MEQETNRKKNDVLLLILVIAVAAVILLMRIFIGDKHPGYVTVRVNGEVLETFDLSIDQTIDINGGTNTIKIQDGEVDMISADCPDKLCVHQKPISANGENIVCLPNRLVVQIVNQDEKILDAVTN